MKQLSMGKYRKRLDKRRINALVADLKESLDAVAVEHKKTKLPALLSMWHWHTKEQKPSEEHKSNVIVITKDGKPILEFFGSKVRAGGCIFHKNLSDEDYKLVEQLAKRHHIYTFEASVQHFTQESRVRYALMGLCMLGLVLLPAFTSIGMKIGMSPLWYMFLGLIFALPLFALAGSKKYLKKKGMLQ